MIPNATSPSVHASLTNRTALRVVTFEAARLDDLSRQITAWLMEHPSMTALSLSHAAETRNVTRDPVSLSGPQRVAFYTAMLLVSQLESAPSVPTA